ncbi:plasmid pRiA4b ORF-3 family protein [Streptomyces sp. NPDC088766]|uniref:plasmid pRiA4b ORF-3 family protein n=1 Tax=Streptomyces sp. NPDC088766 TaxID=3365893 RepID=UPI00380563FE
MRGLSFGLSCSDRIGADLSERPASVGAPDACRTVQRTATDASPCWAPPRIPPTAPPWEHLITVERFQTATAGLHHPHRVGGAGACPPEDCGGGCSDLKVILADPAHEEHHAMLEWLGLRSATEFAPARFTPDDAEPRLPHLTAP